jgi:pimeloyl-ACP methyl ester carboxylesterase
VIASSLTAAYLAGVLDEDAVTVDRLVAICPTAVGGPQPPKEWLRELIRSPLVGEAAFNLLTSKPSIRYFNADHGYYDTANVSDDWTDYEWRTAHQPGARFAPAAFIAGFLNAEVDLAATLRDAAVPTTLVWGREAEITPLAGGRDLAEAADARLVVFDDAKLLPHVEFPAAFLDAVRVALSEAGTDREAAADAPGVTTEREGERAAD